MPRTVLTSALVTRAKERADMESTNHIASAEWYRLLDAGYCRLYNKLVRAKPDMYTKEQTITGVTGTADYAVSTDYYGTVGIEYLNGTMYQPLRELVGDEKLVIGTSESGQVWGYHFVYNTSAQTTVKIRLLPTPKTGESYRHRYIVAPIAIATDGTDTLDGVSGFEEYIVLDMAINARIKEESPVEDLMQRQRAIDEEIDYMIENRTIGTASHVADVRDSDYGISRGGLRQYPWP